jgi:glycosyltransferase involved in cell wall biosynthesis
MKVGVNARTFCVDQPGGAVQASINHTKRLINREDSEVVLFGHKSISNIFPEVTVVDTGYLIPSQLYGLLWERAMLPRLGEKHDIDVLYCPNGNAPVTRTDFQVVMCLHDVNAMKGWSNDIHQLYRKLAVPRGARLADMLVTVSEFSAQEISTHLGISQSKIEVVYNGIDDFFFSEESEKLSKLPENYILFVGSLNPRKNLECLVQSFETVQNRIDDDYKLVIIGPDNKNIFKKVDINETDKIVTPGFVSQAELKYAYEHADVFVFPSLYEGFGLPPLEALACGTPVVTSSTTSLGEIMQEGCIQVDPEDVEDISSAVLRLLEDNTLANQLTDEGIAYSKEFTWERSSDELYDILTDSLAL